ncbi:MAG: segregation/condensation protein A [Peptostreptococcaceae bacterium]|nr:segregation/condensation protein A [Peptostreptococcaceae bacterium]
MDYTIEVGQFSGPFDLLFHLIEKNEINLHDLPISEITSQYIEYMNRMEIIDLDNLSEFILLAATLLEIKSKMLLPDSNEKNMDEKEDPRDELVQKLIEYSKFKKMSIMFDKREQDYSKVLYRKDTPREVMNITTKLNQDIEFEFDENALINALADLLTKLDSIDHNRKKYFNEINPDKWTVEDKINHIRNIFITCKTMDFEKLFHSDTSRDEIITTFLALLELIRTGEIKVVQKHLFDTIKITKSEAGEFKYE